MQAPQDILPILRQFLGEEKRSTHKTGHENYAFFCPLCNHYKPKLEIDLITGRWHCWKCDSKGRSPYSLLKRVNAPKHTLLSVREKYSTVGVLRPHSIISPQEVHLELPSEYVSLKQPVSESFAAKLATKYLERRGLTQNDVDRYEIGYCPSGQYSEKIIIPNRNAEGKLNFFTGRSYNPNSTFKFKTPSVEKDFVGFELFISWKFPVILCEGALDAITIRRNAIPLYGKTISNKLKEKIIKENPPRVYIALDPDAARDVAKIAEYFVNSGIETFLVDLKDGDPSEIGHENFWRLLANAKQIQASDSFEMKFKMML